MCNWFSSFLHLMNHSNIYTYKTTLWLRDSNSTFDRFMETILSADTLSLMGHQIDYFDQKMSFLGLNLLIKGQNL